MLPIRHGDAGSGSRHHRPVRCPASSRSASSSSRVLSKTAGSSPQSRRRSAESSPVVSAPSSRAPAHRSVPGHTSLTLDKRRAHEELIHRKDHVYESIARHVIDQIPVEAATTRVELIIDRSKSKREIISFNGYIARQLRARLDRRVQLHIDHHRSTRNLGLQAADLFSWGIFRRYERNDPTWFDEMSVPCRLGALRLGHPMDGNTRECQASGEEYPRLDIDPSASAL